MLSSQVWHSLGYNQHLYIYIYIYGAVDHNLYNKLCFICSVWTFFCQCSKVRNVFWWGMKEWGHESDNVFNNVESFYFHSSGLQWYVWRCYQSGTAQAALQVAGASPTVEDLTREHIVSQLLSPRRKTANSQTCSCSEPRKTSCATDPRGGGGGETRD